MGITRWIPKSTNTFSEYVILIAIPQQQWFSERASTLRYMYIAPLVSPDLALVPPTPLTAVKQCDPEVNANYRTTHNSE